MTLYQRFRRLLTLPPDEIAKRIIGKLVRPVDRRYDRYRLFARPTYTSSREISHDLNRYFSLPATELLRPYEQDIIELARLYREHCFDLLGSGWVCVKHGIQCAGVEGHHYPASRSVASDAQGQWLADRINSANLAESQHIWSLVDPDYIPIDWHLDFKSGFRWPEATPSTEITYGDQLGVDVKVPWELARMQFLPTLAYAGAITGSASAFAQEFRNQVLDFIATNPPRFGVNWTTTMDVGIRVANWLVAYDLFRSAGVQFDDDFEGVFQRSIHEHGDHIIRHLEWDRALRSNHYLSNIAGLLFVGAYLPSSPKINAWLAFAIQEMVAEVGSQFTPDGANFEASTCYHRLSAEIVVYATTLVFALSPEKRVTLNHYDHSLHQGKGTLHPAPLTTYRYGSEIDGSLVPEWFVERIEKMAEFTLHITRPDGTVPQFGDNDSGRFLKLTPCYDRLPIAAAREKYLNLRNVDLLCGNYYLDERVLDHRHLVAAVNGFFGRADFTEFADGVALETEIISTRIGRKLPSYLGETQIPAAVDVTIGQTIPAVGLNARQTTIPVPANDLFENLQTFGYPDFGVYIFNSKRLYLAIRCGSVGQHGNGGHAHNDQLSFVLCIDGETWIDDPGTYLYTALPARRNDYRSIRAHSAPTIQSREPESLNRGLFTLSNRAHAQCLYFARNGFVGTHKGYDRQIIRTIQIEDNAIQIWDDRDTVFYPTDVSISNGYGKLTARMNISERVRKHLAAEL